MAKKKTSKLGTAESPIPGGLYINQAGRLVNGQRQVILDELLQKLPAEDASRLLKYSANTLHEIEIGRLQTIVSAEEESQPKAAQAVEEKPTKRPSPTRRKKADPVQEESEEPSQDES